MSTLGFRESRKNKDVTLNVTSLIDVLFLLIIFFMLTGTNDSHMKDESFRRGASQFIHKDQFCSDINRWLNEVIGNSSCAA